MNEETRYFNNSKDLSDNLNSEYWLTKLLIDEINEESVFYDVGGFHGYHSIVGGSSSGKVYTFEPDPENIDMLEENISLNEELDIELVRKPLWSEVTEVNLEVGKGGKTSVSEKEGTKIESETIDNFVNERGMSPPDLIKIDVEGAEYQVLKGAERTLEEHSPDLVIEIHGASRIGELGGSEEEIYDLLESKGYSMRRERDLGGRKHCFFRSKNRLEEDN